MRDRFSKDRRFKIASIDVESGLRAMLEWRQWEFIALPELEGVPKDAEIAHVAFNPHRATFDIILHHPSWPVVPPEYEIQHLPVQMTTIRTKLLKEIDLGASVGSSARSAWEFLGAPR